MWNFHWHKCEERELQVALKFLNGWSWPDYSDQEKLSWGSNTWRWHQGYVSVNYVRKRGKNFEDEPLWQKVAWRIPNDNGARKDRI